MPTQYIVANPAYLKSNMDRFIDENNILNIPLTKNLKSNMDRFIGKKRIQFY